MVRVHLLVVAVAGAALGVVLPEPGPARATDRVQVLFLGDDGHHRPYELVATLQAPLFRRGIQLEYTEDLDALTPANLARFDVVAIYANHTAIAPEQEAALLGFVRGGGGLAALHCASYCFLNSPAYVALVGGQFESHDFGTFAARVVEPAHPALRGFETFASADETYRHTKLSDDREVLAVRERAAGEPNGGSEEPWTWVRSEGRGRVFYTASGHDERTWEQPGFVELVARGIRWAGGDAFGEPGLVPDAPFELVETATGVPDYVPGQATGTSHTMQAPLDPEASLARLAVAPGLEARLFASEPLLEGNPIWLAFDARGRAWAVETVDYPNERADAGGHDRIVILEDTD
ncbi:MAG: ThuA domain-containing protein, partial [Acidimicrobiales bacterium]|nr:ThuA domain-containing protein [Acidimicrobiales bacterium]